MSNRVLDTLLLLALPASGKSEIRKYLAGLSAEESRRDFHLGPTLQLDDYPYVHFIKRVDQEAQRRGAQRMFYVDDETPFIDPRDWGTLTALIDEDYADLLDRRGPEQTPRSAARVLLDRIDAASAKVGAPARLAALPAAVRAGVIEALEVEAAELLAEKAALVAAPLEGRTIVLEFARGGPHGAAFPLPAPYGYQHSLSLLSDRLLSRARILYVWVTPEESRRKNQARADPNNPASILHHGVPLAVMMAEYGCDDMDYLESRAARPGTLPVEARGYHFDLPVARFDNRVDKTSFIRGPRTDWKPEEVRALHDGLREALARLAAT